MVVLHPFSCILDATQCVVSRHTLCRGLLSAALHVEALSQTGECVTVSLVACVVAAWKLDHAQRGTAAHCGRHGLVLEQTSSAAEIRAVAFSKSVVVFGTSEPEVFRAAAVPRRFLFMISSWCCAVFFL